MDEKIDGKKCPSLISVLGFLRFPELKEPVLQNDTPKIDDINKAIDNFSNLDTVDTVSIPPVETPSESPSSESPIETPTESPTESPSETPIETPTESPSEISSSEIASESSSEIPSETSSEIPSESSSDIQTESSSDIPSEIPSEIPIESSNKSDSDEDLDSSKQTGQGKKRKSTKKVNKKKSKKVSNKKKSKKISKRKSTKKVRKLHQNTSPSRERLRANRPSPSTGASSQKIGTVMKGNDGNMYKVIKTSSGTRRWVKK